MDPNISRRVARGLRVCMHIYLGSGLNRLIRVDRARLNLAGLGLHAHAFNSRP